MRVSGNSHWRLVSSQAFSASKKSPVAVGKLPAHSHTEGLSLSDTRMKFKQFFKIKNSASKKSPVGKFLVMSLSDTRMRFKQLLTSKKSPVRKFPAQTGYLSL
ncbi:hypothetical protein FCV25MIE_12947 [Fagus crenata]